MAAETALLPSVGSGADRGARIGAFVLDSLTNGLYVVPLDTVREYVANARDSIVEAIRQKLITDREGRIALAIDTGSRTLSIKDSGVGIPSGHARRRLIDVGMSSKSAKRDDGRNIGFRGIGRLGGIAYCRTLELRTSSAGEPVETVVRFDCQAVEKGISTAGANPSLEAGALLDSCVAFESNSAKMDDHFFEVRMIGIKPSVDDFLDVTALNSYLCQSAPVGMDTQRWMLQGEIDRRAANNGLSVPVVKIVIERNKQQSKEIFRPYKSTYHTAKKGRIDIGGVKFIEPTKPGLGYWGWYGVSNLAGQIDDPIAAGIRIRMQGMGFGGPDLMAAIFRMAAVTSERFNGWYIGEIHITDPAVIPNARRDGFEETEAWVSIREDLVIHARVLSGACHKASTARNASANRAKSIVDDVEEKTCLLRKTGIASEGKRDEVLKGIEGTAAVLERLKGRASGNDEAQGIDRQLERLRAAGEQVRDNRNFASSELEAGMDRGQKALLRKILAALQDTLDDATFIKAYEAIGKRLKAKRNKKE